MSFGWSAGDIATAVKLLSELIHALDSYKGVASEYRETQSFLKSLNRTLQPLHALSFRQQHPNTGNEIAEQIACIRTPIEKFLADTKKYAPALGPDAKKGHHRNITRKLQWHVTVSRDVRALRDKISMHMRILDTLMSRAVLYYLVLIYFAQFLKTLFLQLSSLLQPSRVILPVLDAKLNITFLDPIGRAPRVLPYEYFRCYQVLEAFIHHEFRDLPGNIHVRQGRFALFNRKNSQSLNKRNWSQLAVPGINVTMLMRLRHPQNVSTKTPKRNCPDQTCPGSWEYPTSMRLITCPVCEKEVLHSPALIHDETSAPGPPKDTLDENGTWALYCSDFDVQVFKRVIISIPGK